MNTKTFRDKGEFRLSRLSGDHQKNSVIVSRNYNTDNSDSDRENDET
jgi:hypothetical protein